MNNKGKDLALSPVQTASSQDIVIGKGDKWFSRMMTAGMAVTFPGLAYFSTAGNVNAFAVSDPVFAISVFGVITTLTTAVGAILSNVYKADVTRDLIAETIYAEKTRVKNFAINHKMAELKKSADNRLLVNSFAIRENEELDVTTWQLPKNQVTAKNATHIVKNYLIKEKGVFRVEQEVIANNETIWDMSADALVEVYEVQEKTRSLKELNA